MHNPVFLFLFVFALTLHSRFVDRIDAKLAMIDILVYFFIEIIGCLFLLSSLALSRRFPLLLQHQVSPMAALITLPLLLARCSEFYKLFYTATTTIQKSTVGSDRIINAQARVQQSLHRSRYIDSVCLGPFFGQCHKKRVGERKKK